MNPAQAYRSLEAALMTVIPDAVKKAASDEQYYCLRVYFDGTDTPGESYATRLRLLTQDHREKFVAKYPESAYSIWFADETDCAEQGPDVRLDEYREVTEPCRVIYQALCGNEQRHLKLLRRTIRRVAERLNRLDWTTICRATDDFVVFPADGSHTFHDDFAEMAASVPLPRLRLLRSRRFLPAWAYAYLFARRVVGKYWK